MIRVFDPYLYFPPTVRLRALIAEGEIGELTTVRVRALLAGKGGAAQFGPPFGDAPLRHPAFDRFLLLAFLGGAASKLTAYVQPMDASGGQAQVACQYSAGGRYGLLECVYAPEMYVRSDHWPHDLTVEVAGTDGVIWMRRGMAATTAEPPLFVRTGQSAYSIGIETGMTADWRDAYRAAVAEMGEAVAGRVSERMPAADVVSALAMREKVHAAALGDRTISL
jgi:predicted dehydrogenase